MKVTPIIMSGAMVKSLLGEVKTQTRRIMKPQPIDEGIGLLWGSGKLRRGWYAGTPHNGTPHPDCFVWCPFGKRGDALWVRETFVTGRLQGLEEHNQHIDDEVHIYKADCDSDNPPTLTWTPSIFMPRRASRLTLELSGVRVQRLQDISEEDAIAEGIEPVFTGAKERCGWLDYQHVGAGVGYFPSPIDSYYSLFRSLHGIDIVGKNPWLWVLQFSTHQVNVDAFLKTREVAA
jgi:hypothetical protein